MRLTSLSNRSRLMSHPLRRKAVLRRVAHLTSRRAVKVRMPARATQAHQEMSLVEKHQLPKGSERHLQLRTAGISGMSTASPVSCTWSWARRMFGMLRGFSLAVGRSDPPTK